MNHYPIAVIGSGPAGIFLSRRLLKLLGNSVHISMLETLNWPFGLLRYGVAPDHPEMKLCIEEFETLNNDDRFTFYGGITIGDDIGLEVLKGCFSAVVLCTGMSKSRKLDIQRPISSPEKIITADKFIGWINGHPDYQNLGFELADCRNISVIGNGNVALDTARLLLKDPLLLEHSDISTSALKALFSSNINSVDVFARRGPIYSAFSVKEYRELVDLGVRLFHHKQQLSESAKVILKNEFKASRRTKRLLELMESSCDELSNFEQSSYRKSCRFFYNHTLSSIGVSGSSLIAKFRTHDDSEFFDTDAIITCIGYESCGISLSSINDFPLYKCGWASTGATGNINSTLLSTTEVADKIVRDFSSFLTPINYFEDLIKHKFDFYDYQDWSNDQKIEIEEGRIRNKVAEKLRDNFLIKYIRKYSSRFF